MKEKIQITLLVEEGKELIAMAITNHPKFQGAKKRGKIILKGGSTVSRISELLTGRPLSISGRITSRGTVAGLYEGEEPHVSLLEGNQVKNIDKEFLQEVLKLGPNDLIVCGANAIDSHGNAGIMSGSPGGGDMAYAFSSWYGEGVPVLIPVGIEKMIPGNIKDIVQRTGRKRKKLSMGMAVGLIPVWGEIITEVEALKLMANVEAEVIGAGGLGQAQGSITLDLWGDKKELEKIIQLITPIKIKAKTISADTKSLIECKAPCQYCREHLACGYRANKF